MTTPYTDADAVAAYLGVTLTAAQVTQAGTLALAATVWIDRYTGRSWQAASPVTAEVHTVEGDTVYLNRRPVTAVTQVQTRADVIGATYTTLAAGQYELLNPANGVLQLVGWGNYLARVNYTHTATPAPDDVALAAAMIAAGWLQAALRPGTQGIDQLSVGQSDIAIRFSVTRGDVPAEAGSILAGYRMPVIA